MLLFITLFLCSCQTTITSQIGAGSQGNQLRDAGRNEEALEFYKKQLGQIIPKYGDKSAQAAVIYNDISVAYLNLGENEKSLIYSNKARIICETLGDDRGLAVVNSNIGEAYFYMEDYETALKYYKKTLKTYQRIYGKGSLDAITIVQIMSDAYKNSGDYNKSLELLNEIIETDMKENGEKSDSLKYAYRRKGDVYKLLNDNTNAFKLYMQAIESNQKTKTPGLLFEANTNIKIGNVFSEKEPKKAIDYYQRSLDYFIMEQEQTEKTVQLYYQIMLNYESLNDFITAQEYGIKLCKLAETEGTEAELSEEDINKYKEGLKRIYNNLNGKNNPGFEVWYQENVLEK